MDSKLGKLETAPAIVIMAAGKGTRLKSKRPKVLHEIGGKPLLLHVIAAASELVAAQDIVVVIGHQADRVRAAVEHTGVRFVEQTEQRGTGHAVQSAAEAIAGYEHFLVLSGDVPLITPRTIDALWKFHREQQAAMTLVSADMDDPRNYGRVIRKSQDSADVVAIVEQACLKPEQLALREINMGMYAFTTAPMLAHMGRLKTENPHGEFYLTDMAELLDAAGERVVAFKTPEFEELLGVNTIAELAALDATLRAHTARRLMDDGVTIFKPETCVIDADVEVGPDTVIEPFVQLRGNTRIGSDSTIRSYTVIQNCIIGDEVEVLQGCILSQSKVDNGARLGPYSHLRPGCEIGEKAHMGNFVEGKKVRLGKGAKANHLTYLGDAEVGEGSNIGAGTITCNYDGVNKHRTLIGKNAFVGSDSTLVAPVSIGDGAYIGAGSCITKEVPADALAVGRARQMVKPNWAAARRARRETKDVHK